MNLPDFLLFAPFNALRQDMGGAPLGDFTLELNYVKLTLEEQERLAHAGIEVGIDDITVLPDGTLAYKNSRVLVYIRDVPEYSRYGQDNELPRFHVSHCTTLQEMRDKNRWGRYVVATREDGKFEIRLVSKTSDRYRSRIEELVVCKNCLSKLQYEGYSNQLARQHRNRIVKQFSMLQFFSRYSKLLHSHMPDHDSDSAPVNGYTENFNELSNQVKQAANWTCSSCNIYLGRMDLRRYLGTHHVNGLKYDNRPGNLVPLCIGCHAEEANHAHMKALNEYKEFMRITRGLRFP